MNYRSRASQGMAALILLAALFALRLERTHAFVAQPAPGKNYQLRLTHQTAHNFNVLEDEGEESLRVEETLMRTSRHPKVLRWREKLDRLKGLGPLEQLEAVNRMVNDDIHYRPDYSHWNRQDKWGFPLATLDEGGDCEDYAMLKRVSLHYLGWPEGGLYLLIGFSTFGSQPETHAVLMATLPDGSQLILDSLEKHVLPPSDDHHFNPMMALDRGSFYLVGREPAALPVSSTWKPAAGGTRALAGIFQALPACIAARASSLAKRRGQRTFSDPFSRHWPARRSLGEGGNFSAEATARLKPPPASRRCHPASRA